VTGCQSRVKKRSKERRWMVASEPWKRIGGPWTPARPKRGAKGSTSAVIYESMNKHKLKSKQKGKREIKGKRETERKSQNRREIERKTQKRKETERKSQNRKEKSKQKRNRKSKHKREGKREIKEKEKENTNK
jgi:hypothetical protein